MTSSESNHNKETFFFLRISSIYIVVMCLTVAYYICYIYYRVTYSKSEVEIMHSYYNAIILFYVKVKPKPLNWLPQFVQFRFEVGLVVMG